MGEALAIIVVVLGHLWLFVSLPTCRWERLLHHLPLFLGNAALWQWCSRAGVYFDFLAHFASDCSRIQLTK